MHLRLCGFSAMAPALTEAASQAQNFKLPYTSPTSAETAPISLLDEAKNRIKLDHDLTVVKKGVEYEEAAQGLRNKRLLLKSQLQRLKKGATGGEEEAKQVSKCMMSSGEVCEDMGMLKTMSKKVEVVDDEGSKPRTRLDEMSERNMNLKRRTDYLTRVVLKLQGRQLERQVLGELGVLVEHHHTTLQLPSRRERLQQGLKAVIANSGGSVNNTDLKAEILQCEDVKNLSTAALVNLVRKLESTHGSPHRQKYVTLQHLRSVDKVENAATGVKLPVELCKEMERVGSTLRTNVRHLEKAIDSDATESSSGGESCDELEGYDEKRPHTVPINKRAAWKWAMDRSAVACRWTWLQAQVSDLEYRIRQQNDTYRKLRNSKSPVQLEPQPANNHPTIRACLAQLPPSRLGQTKSPETPAVVVPLNNSRVNGFVGKNSSPGETAPPVTNGDVENNADDATCTASRTRALTQFRKRKLVDARGLDCRSEKAAKLSTVRCSCFSVPVAPCVICGGRVNNTMKLEADAMPLEERVALLDPSFHPVLSFEQDVVTHLRFEALINRGDWHRVGQKQKVATAARKRGHLGVASSNDVHKRSRKLKKNATATLTA
uniref:Uncharacterized protein n=1 Tax=Strigamia maritima TaxID=126957 RepID=T1IZF2_STRMM